MRHLQLYGSYFTHFDRLVNMKQLKYFEQSIYETFSFQFACSYLTQVAIPTGPEACSPLELKVFAKQMARDIVNSRDLDELDNICHRCGLTIALGELKYVFCCSGDCYPRRRVHVKKCSSEAERARKPYTCNVCSVAWTSSGALLPTQRVAMYAKRTQQTRPRTDILPVYSGRTDIPQVFSSK